MEARYKKLYLLLGIVLMFLTIAWPTAVIAASSASSAVLQSYNAESSVLPSMIVELSPKDKITVEPLSSTDIKNMLGVVVPPQNATISLAPQTTSSQQVLVAANGLYNVLVSNENGSIKAGDYLTMSALSGIAMKADTTQPLIIGRAVDNFSGSNSISSASLINAQGSATHVAIGRIAVNVQLAPNPLYLKNSNSILVFLTRAEYDVTNKSVSSLRTYLSGLVFLATTLVTVVVLYTGTRTAIIAIGRNPLARSTIGRGMMKTVGVGIFIFLAGIAMVYFILTT